MISQRQHTTDNHLPPIKKIEFPQSPIGNQSLNSTFFKAGSSLLNNSNNKFRNASILNRAKQMDFIKKHNQKLGGEREQNQYNNSSRSQLHYYNPNLLVETTQSPRIRVEESPRQKINSSQLYYEKYTNPSLLNITVIDNSSQILSSRLNENQNKAPKIHHHFRHISEPFQNAQNTKENLNSSDLLSLRGQKLNDKHDGAAITNKLANNTEQIQHISNIDNYALSLQQQYDLKRTNQSIIKVFKEKRELAYTGLQLTQQRKHIYNLSKEQQQQQQQQQQPTVEQLKKEKYSLMSVLSIAKDNQVRSFQQKQMHVIDFMCMGQSFYNRPQGAKPTEFKIEGITITTEEVEQPIKRSESGDLEQWNTTSYQSSLMNNYQRSPSIAVKDKVPAMQIQ